MKSIFLSDRTKQKNSDITGSREQTWGLFYCNTLNRKCAIIVSHTRQLGVAPLILMVLTKMIMKGNEGKIKVPERKKFEDSLRKP